MLIILLLIFIATNFDDNDREKYLLLLFPNDYDDYSNPFWNRPQKREQCHQQRQIYIKTDARIDDDVASWCICIDG